MSTPEPPEFGPNGAVVNQPGLSERMRKQLRGEPLEPLPVEKPTTLLGWIGHGLWRAMPLLVMLWIIWTTPLIDTRGERTLMSVLFGVIFIRPIWPVGRIERWFWTAATIGLMVYFLWITSPWSA